jgi:hypothetical protein
MKSCLSKFGRFARLSVGVLPGVASELAPGSRCLDLAQNSEEPIDPRGVE